MNQKSLNQRLRAARVRARISGSATRPRLTVSISNKHVSAQLIDDDKQHTIVSATTVGTKQAGTLTEQAEWVGKEIAKKAKKAGVTTIVFDRNGRQYAQRLAALATAARNEGLEF